LPGSAMRRPDELDDIFVHQHVHVGVGAFSGFMWLCRRTLSLWRPTRERS